MERFWLICYDIADSKRLRRIAYLMKGYGVRVQRSVFECWLTDAKLKQLKAASDKIIIAEEDDIRYYVLCATCRETARHFTQTPIPDQEKFYIV